MKKYMQRQQKAVDNRLVQHIDEQRTPSHCRQKRQAAFVCLFGTGKAAEEIAGEEQEKPGQEGEIVGGKEAGGRKAQVCSQMVLVELGWEGGNVNALEAQEAGIDIPQEQEQEKTPGQSEAGGDFFQGRTEGEQEQGRTAQECEDAAKDEIFREKHCGDEGEKEAAAERY